MVETNMDTANDSGHIVLSPNLSAQWKTNKYLIYLISGFALGIGVGFAFVGLWMILPFAGLEVIAVITLIYHTSRKCNRKEVIRFNKEWIRVECGYTHPKTQWQSELFWTRLIVSPRQHPWHPDKLILRGRHDQIEVGQFLNEQDKDILVNQLRHVVSVA